MAFVVWHGTRIVSIYSYPMRLDFMSIQGLLRTQHVLIVSMIDVRLLRPVNAKSGAWATIVNSTPRQKRMVFNHTCPKKSLQSLRLQDLTYFCLYKINPRQPGLIVKQREARRLLS